MRIGSLTGRLRATIAAAGAAAAVAAVTTGWFGDMRRWTPWVHTDDHRNLAKQALFHLVKVRAISEKSEIAENAELIARSCGLLDVMEGEMGRVPGTLDWEYSHLYDPVAGHGIDDHRYVNALDEFRDLWERSLIHHRIGSDTKAFRFLGYCCHLLQDMTVPAHTYLAEHGLKSRTADNLELLSRHRRFYLREPDLALDPGDPGAHVLLFTSTALESRGLDPDDPGLPNEIAPVLERYYIEPSESRGIWRGAYRGEPYYPYHRLLPSSPRIQLVDLVTLRNYLMEKAAAAAALLIRQYTSVTGAGR